MRGAAAGSPGQVFISEFPEPTAGEDDLILQTLACGVCSTDLKMVKKGGEPQPRFALGHEMVGKVLRAPKGSPWRTGQRVVAAPYLPCGKCAYCLKGQETLCRNLFDIYCAPGGLAERILVPPEMARRGLIPVPDELSDELAALAEPLGCVIKGFEDSCLTPGEALLVIGDGSMGQLVAAAGKAMGATPVIVAGMTPHRLAVAREHYADVTIDVAREDIRQAVHAATGESGAGVVMVAVSNGKALQTGIDCVRPGGRVNMFAGVPEGTEICLGVRKVHYQQYHLTGSFGTAPRHMQKALEMLQAKQVDFSPIITASFVFERTADAFRHMQNCEGLKAMVVFPQAGG